MVGAMRRAISMGQKEPENRRGRCLTSAAGAALLALFALAARPDALGAAETKKVRLAYAGWGVGSAIAYVGIDGGVFKKFDLEIEEIFIHDALSGGVQALIGADFLLGFGNPLAFIRPVLSGADIVLIGSHVTMEKYAMAVAPEIATLQDLKGKKVGVSTLGGTSDLAARVILRRAGLDPNKDVEIVAAGLSPNRAAALAKKLIQGAPLSPDVVPQAKKLGLKVIEVKDVPTVRSLLLTTRSFINKDSELVRRFVKAYSTAIHFFLTRRNDSIGIIRKYFSGTDPANIESMYDAFAAQLGPLPFPDDEAVQALIDAAGVADERASQLKPRQLYDLRFLEELKASGYIQQLYIEKFSL